MKYTDKIKETIGSRKFWATVGTMAMAVALFLAGQIDVDKMIDIIRWAAGLWVGSLGLIDAFKQFLPTARSINIGE